ncbi:MAG: hypothetical protein KJO54_08665 [Gammaproteobacteria bacterium]|nr:hypothetical protein [Gammaproteobacteria bacterium]NNF62570.1 hypothetical protein [Gammaproteobacteria bacterium]NNM20727.1 hypothetical protein [Gammaproteobacteria bacterium]
MSTDDIDYDEELYTDTSMFDADEIVRSVEEVAQKKKDDEKKLSARKRFEMMMEDRKLAEELGDAFDDDWSDDWNEEWCEAEEEVS